MTRRLNVETVKGIRTDMNEKFGSPLLESDGEQKTLRACNACKGQGKRWEEWHKANVGKKMRRVVCHNCKGRGVIESKPQSVDEGEGCGCGGMMTFEGDTCGACGRMGENLVREGRNHVSTQEVEATWEDLYMQLGTVGLDDLSSWLAAPENVVAQAIQRVGWLAVDRNGNVVERGISSN